MSRNGTMNSSISQQAFQQQQQNLQQLQTMENNNNQYQQAKSFTSMDSRARQYQQQQLASQGQAQQLAQGPQQLAQGPQQQYFDSEHGAGTSAQQFPNTPFSNQQHLNSLSSNMTPQQAANRINQQSYQQQISSQPLPSVQIQQQSRNVSSNANGKNDPRNIFAVQLPIHSNPPEVLANRFIAWRNTITSLQQYVSEVANIQDEVVRQQIRLTHAVNFPAFRSDAATTTQDQAASHSHQLTRITTTSNNSSASHKQDAGSIPANFFLPQGNGSVQDLPNILINYHSSFANLASKTSKELTLNIIPRLEDLRRELLIKIKEIKGLNSDFKNNISKEMAQTKADLSNFLKSIDDAKFNNAQPKSDPYLTKIILDKQIKRQLIEENYLHEAFINLQSSGKELEKVVVIEIQNALTTYAKLFGEQAQNIFEKLISPLDNGFLTKPPSFEWDNFIARDLNFIDENLPKRDYKLIQYDKMNDPLSLEIKSSFLERRSKFLKSYSKAFYVLTSSFIHEFKSPDRKKDIIPVTSLSIDEIELVEYSKKESNQYKFVIKKVGKLSSQKFIFRAESYESMYDWYNTIKNLKKLPNAIARSQFASKLIKERKSKQNNEDEDNSRTNSTLSRVLRPASINDDYAAHETDTILSVPNQQRSLPHESSTPIPQNLIGSEGVIVQPITSSHDLSPQQLQQLQRQSIYNQQQQQQQRANAPYPNQPPFQEIPQMNVELATPQPSSPALNRVRNSVELNNSQEENGDASGFSEETRTAKKETHNDDDLNGQSAEPDGSVRYSNGYAESQQAMQQKQYLKNKRLGSMDSSITNGERIKPNSNQFRTLDLKQAKSFTSADQPYNSGNIH